MKTYIKYVQGPLILLILWAGSILAQDIPGKPFPQRLVNDYTNTLNQQEKDALERMLVDFNDSTSNQITIVMVNSFNGMDKAVFADLIGEQWGVGQKEFDNGIVILVRPRNSSQSGEAWIAIGYGLEGAIPDVTVKRIIENEMIPRFKENDYYSGLLDGSRVLMALAAGEYSFDQYAKDTKPSPYAYLVIIIIMVAVGMLMRQTARRSKTIGGSIPFWTALWLGSTMGRGGSSHSGWGGSSSGGIGGGGFGGFGGGSFGGGGAGGSW